MDNRPLGVFDSGLGGLTAVKRLMEVLPHEDIIYLGDTGRVPYGGRSPATIIKYARQDIAFLKSFDIKAVVIACGTVSTTALDTIRPELDIPVYGVVEPSVEKALRLTQNGRIGLIGTSASIRSGAYERRLKALRPDVFVFGKACPLFVPLVEDGRYRPGDKVIEIVAREYLEEIKALDVDTLILGCTHYPLLSDIIADIMGSGVALVNSGAAAAESVAEELRRSDALGSRTDTGSRSYFVTDSTDGFARMASMFLDSDVIGAVKQVSLENF